ncbi:MAG TPA: hypothetical protein VEF71_07605, partial [Streptosporangiaceae bacterium]|nr:hypothetical protein [Streptosporangiaceae bacterium]
MISLQTRVTRRLVAGYFLSLLSHEVRRKAGDAWAAGCFEGDGDGGGGEADDTCQAADDGLAGDGAVLVVVAQVGVEAAGEPVLGVAGEQPQHHLQGAP